MDALKDFYDFYRPLQRKYDLRMFYKTNGKETKITIRQRDKELVKVTEETTEACFIRAKRELEERMKKYEQQIETKGKTQRAGFYMDKIRESYAEKQQQPQKARKAVFHRLYGLRLLCTVFTPWIW